MTVEIKHNLGKEKGKECAEKIFSGLADEYKHEFSELVQDKTEDGLSFSFLVKGFRVRGNIKVEENNVVIESKLPFALKFFQNKIEELIKENADKYLSKC